MTDEIEKIQIIEAGDVGDFKTTLGEMHPEALQAIQAIIDRSIVEAKRQTEQYWIDLYSRSIKSLDGFEDKPEIDRLKTLRKQHQKRLSTLTEQATDSIRKALSK